MIVRWAYGNVFLANSVNNAGVVIVNINTLNSGTILGRDTVLGDGVFLLKKLQ